MREEMEDKGRKEGGMREGGRMREERRDWRVRLINGIIGNVGPPLSRNSRKMVSG